MSSSYAVLVWQQVVRSTKEVVQVNVVVRLSVSVQNEYRVLNFSKALLDSGRSLVRAIWLRMGPATSGNH